jgi:hypothetical protein
MVLLARSPLPPDKLNLKEIEQIVNKLCEDRPTTSQFDDKESARSFYDGLASYFSQFPLQAQEEVLLVLKERQLLGKLLAGFLGEYFETYSPITQGIILNHIEDDTDAVVKVYHYASKSSQNLSPKIWNRIESLYDKYEANSLGTL